MCYIESLQSWLLSVWFEIPRDFMDYRSYMGLKFENLITSAIVFGLVLL
jgi:hypothetical protein